MKLHWQKKIWYSLYYHSSLLDIMQKNYFVALSSCTLDSLAKVLPPLQHGHMKYGTECIKKSQCLQVNRVFAEVPLYSVDLQAYAIRR